MKQVCLRDVKTIAVEETDVPQAVGNKVLIKTKATGICGTDVHSYMGESIFGKLFPLHIGHEAAGIVEATGPDCTRIRPGDHVVIDPLMELTQGMGGDVVFEASGSVHTTRLTSQLVKVGGKIVLVGLTHAPVDYDFFSVARKKWIFWAFFATSTCIHWPEKLFPPAASMFGLLSVISFPLKRCSRPLRPLYIRKTRRQRL